MIIYGKEVYKKRIEQSKSRKEIAHSAGIAVRTLKNIECSKENQVSMYTINELAKALDCSFWDITQRESIDRFMIYDQVESLNDDEVKMIVDTYLSHFAV